MGLNTKPKLFPNGAKFKPPELYREKVNVACNSIDPKIDYNAGIDPAGSEFRVAQASRLLAMASRHRELSQEGTLSTGAVAPVKKFVSASTGKSLLRQAQDFQQQTGRLCYPETKALSRGDTLRIIQQAH